MSELVVITGASRGIGRACALAFADRGYSLALLGRPSAELDGAVAACVERGVHATAIACDVASAEEVERAASEVVTALGAPLVVVNNAAIVARGPDVVGTPVEDWDRVIAVNLRGPFLVSRAFLPSMIARGRGRLIHIASISSTLACPGNAAYGASKWALVGLSKSLAEELRPRGLESIAILPGSVDTRMLEGSGFAPQMTPADIANTVVYAALDAPAQLTGAAVEVFG